jgi:hypothetical protein
MIVVLSRKRVRIQSGQLLTKLEKLHANLISDPDYGQNSNPKPRENSPSIGVRAILDKNAMERLATEDNFAGLDLYRGTIARAKTSSELKEVD